MNDPLAIALREVSETRQLIEGLVISSENFDYQRAKEALKLLERKRRFLVKLQKEFSMKMPKAANIAVVNFQAATKTSPTAQL